jgi:uncharacterized membrane protein
MNLATLPHFTLRRASATASVRSQTLSMETLISQVLRIGVTLSAALIVFGVALIEGPNPAVPASLAQLNAGADLPLTLSFRSILYGAAQLHATAVIELGLLVLILTPIARVAMTVVLFARQYDRTFVAITVVVLLILVIGFLGLAS